MPSHEGGWAGCFLPFVEREERGGEPDVAGLPDLLVEGFLSISIDEPDIKIPLTEGRLITDDDLYLRPSVPDKDPIEDALPGQNLIGPVEPVRENWDLLDSEKAGDHRESGGKKSDEKDWFAIPEHKLTPELLNELRVIQLRNFAEPGRFFKKTDLKKLPTRFHVATVVNSRNAVGEDVPLAVGRSRKTKSIVRDFVRDHSVRAFTKRKALALHANAVSGGKSWYRRKSDRYKNKA